MPKQIREVYGSVLAELGETNENIVVLDADLSGSTKSAIFGKAHPERFFNMGIAEQNMVATGRRHGCLRQDPVREHLYGFPHLAGSALGSRPDMLRKPERQVRRAHTAACPTRWTAQATMRPRILLSCAHCRI